MASYIDSILNDKKEDNYYEIIGVGQNASAEQIKTEYRIKAMKCHPDKNSDFASVDMFQKLQVAMETISDPEKRLDYDRWLRCGISMPYEKWTAFKSTHKMSMHWATKEKTDPMIEYEDTKEAKSAPTNEKTDPMIESEDTKEVKEAKIIKVNHIYSLWNKGDASVDNSVLSKFRRYQV